MYQVYDLAIIGGGINGCGIARDAAGRGFSVFLCEMNDLASGTSSWSTKLIHGGLRYLEYYEFRLVREALIEREVLWRMAPHIIKPLRFVLPHHRKLRPAWLLRLGLFLYDHLGGRKLLPPTRTLDLARDRRGRTARQGPVHPRLRVFRLLRRRRAAGAAQRARCGRARRRRQDPNPRDARSSVPTACGRSRSKTRTPASARPFAPQAIVNAAGPWVEDVLTRTNGVDARAAVRLVQGSHIVVRRLYAHDRAYMFQNEDGRIVFVIPYENDFTLIGTTDRDYQGDPAKVEITKDEIDYLCQSVSGYFAQPVTPADVVWTYAGVRPLYDDGASEAKAATRDYVFELDATDNLPLLSIFGGKITTYRRLAEEALERLAPYLPESPREREGWTASSTPARRRFRRARPCRSRERTCAATGRSSSRSRAAARALLRHTRARHPQRRHIVRRSWPGTSVRRLTEAEVRFAMATEWARDRRRHALAALQARPAADAARGRGTRCLDARRSAKRAATQRYAGERA